MVADTTLVRCYQSHQSPYVAAAAAGEAAGVADLVPSAATAGDVGHHRADTPSPSVAAEAARPPKT